MTEYRNSTLGTVQRGHYTAPGTSPSAFSLACAGLATHHIYLLKAIKYKATAQKRVPDVYGGGGTCHWSCWERIG